VIKILTSELRWQFGVVVMECSISWLQLNWVRRVCFCLLFCLFYLNTRALYLLLQFSGLGPAECFSCVALRVLVECSSCLHAPESAWPIARVPRFYQLSWARENMSFIAKLLRLWWSVRRATRGGNLGNCTSRNLQKTLSGATGYNHLATTHSPNTSTRCGLVVSYISQLSYVQCSYWWFYS